MKLFSSYHLAAKSDNSDLISLVAIIVIRTCLVEEEALILKCLRLLAEIESGFAVNAVLHKSSFKIGIIILFLF